MLPNYGDHPCGARVAVSLVVWKSPGAERGEKVEALLEAKCAQPNLLAACRPDALKFTH